MAIESYTVIDGQRVNDPGDVSPTDAAAAANGTDTPGATPAPPAGGHEPSASPPDSAQPAGGGEPPAGDTEDDEPLRDDSEITAARLERRFKRLTAARRQAERERDAQAQQHQIELAQTRGQLEALSRMMQGAAPDLPQAPTQPTGPPQAEQYASHEDYVLAAARYGAQQEFAARDQQTQAERQREQQMQFQRDLLAREETFKQAHPDFDTVVRTGLAGKVSPVVQQALMLVPDGPAVAYTLAQQPDLVQRLNSLPPPLVLVELGRLSPPTTQPPAPTPAVGFTTNGAAALPAPPSPLSGSGGGGTAALQYRDDMSQSEFEQWRKKTSSLSVWKGR